MRYVQHTIFNSLIGMLFAFEGLMSYSTLSAAAIASCDYDTPSALIFSSVMGATGSAANLKVWRSLPVGGVIDTASTKIGIRCTGKPAIEFQRTDVASGTVADAQKIYDTKIKGLGLRISIKDVVTTAANPPSTIAVGTRLFSIPNTRFTFSATVQVDLIKTVDSSVAALSGRLTGTDLEVIKILLGEEGTTVSLSSLTYRLSGVTVVDVGCSVDSKNINVPLGCVSVSQLMGVGGTTAPTKNFAITMDCAAGTRPWIAFADASDASNRSNLLSLSKDSLAKGVGISVTDDQDGASVFYGADSLDASNPWRELKNSGGKVILALTARYMWRRPEKITPGSANGLATFTMNYR